MSVAAYIVNAESKEEEAMYIPVSSESVFDSYWLSGCQKNDLSLVSEFAYGLEIDKNNYSAVLDELRLLKSWFEKKETFSQNQSLEIIQRISYLSDELKEIYNQDKFGRDSIVLCVG
ncbi:MAG: hypothetical protein AAFV90_26415 [Cyanobacteria bacterium J06634_5]